MWMRRKRGAVAWVSTTVMFCWMSSWIFIGNRTNVVLAQGAAKAADRTTTLINRKPARVIGDDPYSNFTGVAIDEERGHVFLSNDSDAHGSSIETYNAEFPAGQSDRITEPIRQI